MKLLLRWFFSVVLICSFIAFSPIQNIVYGQENQDDRAADFILKDLDGRNIRLSDYKGKTIVLYFMATWCPECRGTIPQLKEIYSSYREKGLILLSIDVMESKEKAAAFSRKYNIPYPILLDEDGKVYRNYGVGGVPLKALIDRTGRIICWNCRSFDDLLAKQFEVQKK